MKNPVIAIDGFSSTGKSSISKVIAKKLGLLHLDTGALYRGITYYALKNCLDENGNIASKGNYKNGKPDGDITYYDENGNIEQVDKYENGELVK